MDNEKDIQMMIQRMNEQQKMFGANQQQSHSVSQQSFIPGPPPTPVSTPGACPQCGMIHPPLRPGQRCPMAPVNEKESGGASNDEVNKYIADIKNIVISQIGKKQIKDGNKFFKHVIVELTKIMENYNE